MNFRPHGKFKFLGILMIWEFDGEFGWFDIIGVNWFEIVAFNVIGMIDNFEYK